MSSGNPFEGFGFLGDLARMLQQQGPVSWSAAAQIAVSIATEGQSEPNVDPQLRMELEELGRVAELQVEGAIGLSPAVTGRAVRILPVNRSQWVQRSLDAYRPVLEDLAASLAPPPDETEDQAAADPEAWLGQLMSAMGPMMLGLTTGSMIGHLARRSFGQYDLPVPRPPDDELVIVPANIESFVEEWSLPADGVRLWVCIHEMASHCVLNVRHVRERLQSLLKAYAGGFDQTGAGLEHRLEDLDPTSLDSAEDLQRFLSDPEVLLGAIESPAQRELRPSIDALVAAVVGVVDHVVDDVGGRLISSCGMVTEAVRRRRVTEDSATRFVERLLGLELSQATYDRGLAFADGVVERAGPEGLERLWKAERNLPTPAEVDAPGLWLARIELPED